VAVAPASSPNAIRAVRRRGSQSIHDETRDDGLAATGGDAQEVDQWDLPLGSLAQPDVVGRVGIGAHEGIVQLILAGEDLVVDLVLVVVPDRAPCLGKTVRMLRRKGIPRGLTIPR
jgi:hypothetical protein